jgi:hypothetical protein
MTARWDALSRIGPVAAPLLARVDTALVRHGAPSGHAIWAQLRRLGTTPADAVAFFVEADPAGLRAAADQLRAEAEAYRSTTVPTDVRWEGAAAETYAVRSIALRDHLTELIGRLTGTADYADRVADWWDDSRAAVATALAEVLTSAQAITVSTAPALAGDGQPPAAVVVAAADLGAHVLTAVLAAYDAGQAVLEGAGDLSELTFRPATDPTRRPDVTIELHS